MPNLAFQIEVLKKTITERAAAGDAMAQNLGENNFSNSLMPFAVLGAMGPDVLRYMPISSALATFLSGLVPPPSNTLSAKQITDAVSSATSALQALPTGTSAQQALAFELYFNPLGAAYSVLFSTVVIPVWPILNQVTDTFNTLDAIVQAGNTVELLEMLGTVEKLQNLQSSFSGLSATVSVLQVVIGAIVAEGPWMEMNETALAALVPFASPIADRRYEFLRWHHTGAFARNLVAKAATMNQNAQAYAFGWFSHIAASVTAEPFVNNIVGGPYRTHWWRNRLAGNFVDSWTFGFFEQNPAPTMGGSSGDNPTPVYCDPQTGAGWPSICSANLQDLFNVANLAGPSSAGGVPDAVTAMASGDLSTLLGNFPFPSEIATLLNDTIAVTYTAALGSPVFPSLKLPIVGVDLASMSPIPAFAADTFARAYIGAFAVYWFMTSGSGPVDNNPTGVPTGMPEPAWIANGTAPTVGQAAQNINVAGAICAVLLAIFAVFEILTGNFVAGLAALAAAINAPIINWSEVANDLFWLRKTLVDQENLLRDALVWSALAYPPPVLLGMIDPNGNTLPVTDLTQGQGLPSGNVPATQGVPLCKTNADSPDSSPWAPTGWYPRWLDLSMVPPPPATTGIADLNWVTYPGLNVPPEAANTKNLIAANAYPNSLIVNGATVSNGGIMGANASSWPNTGYNLFGDAVANAVQLLATKDAKGLVDFNLDGDRGYGWLTWDPAPASNPFTPPVNVQPEP
jgi:hypothetical protein